MNPNLESKIQQATAYFRQCDDIEQALRRALDARVPLHITKAQIEQNLKNAIEDRKRAKEILDVLLRER